ncbi:hypothetical protein MNBD_GAMMA25-417, partial [hydrothermal vent metagenome]
VEGALLSEPEAAELSVFMSEVDIPCAGIWINWMHASAIYLNNLNVLRQAQDERCVFKRFTILSVRPERSRRGSPEQRRRGSPERSRRGLERAVQK